MVVDSNDGISVDTMVDSIYIVIDRNSWIVNNVNS